MNSILLCFIVTFAFLNSSILHAQQEYSANSVMLCNNSHESKPSPAFLYSCNGNESPCRAFLIFKSRPPYNSVPTISTLVSSDPSEIARVNNVTKIDTFPTGKEVIVPVNCSCSGLYYQANTTFHIPDERNTYFIVANDTYQGLSTCNSIKRVNPYHEFGLQPNFELKIPLRCACPTRAQTESGIKYLLTYSITWHDTVYLIGNRFNISSRKILDANGFSEENPTVFPFTTILLPLQNEPLSSHTIIQPRKPTLLPPYLPTTTTTKKRRRRNHNLGLKIAAVCSLLLLSIISLTVFLFYKKKKQRIHEIDNEGKTKTVLPKDLIIEIASFDQGIKAFSYNEIKAATENFGSTTRIKGSVYRGVFNGETLAVKRMSSDVTREVNMLTKINHFNLIKLQGICKEDSGFYLVFEYMKNGSVREWLHRSCSKSWKERVQIALDVANGLHYLHNFAKPAYVHRAINSSNVLLNKNLRAKITNFSLARTTANENDSFPTTRVVGSRGYMAPEYVMAGTMTPKTDVYAFGVLLMELITGKNAVFVEEGRERLLPAAMGSIMEGGDAENELGQFIDSGLGENGGIGYALWMAKLSLTCLRRDAEDRPSIGEVVSVLVKIQMDLQKLGSSDYAFILEKD